MLWGYLLVAFAAGLVLPFQAGAHAELADWVHSPIRAAFVSFLVGTLALLVIAVFVSKPLPSWTRLGDAPRWVWIAISPGRIGGMALIAAGVVLVRIF